MLTEKLLFPKTVLASIYFGIPDVTSRSAITSLNVSFGIALSEMASFLLAGLAGGLLLPNQSLSTGLGDSYLMYAFFAVIIGGLGNIRGAFIGSLVLGLVQSLNTVLLPSVPGLAIYVVPAAFLLWKPSGLFPAVGAHSESGPESHGTGLLHRPRISRSVWQVLGVATVGVLATLPLWVNAGPLYVVGTVLVQVVFSLSGRAATLHPLIADGMRAALPPDTPFQFRPCKGHHAAARLALKAAQRDTRPEKAR